MNQDALCQDCPSNCASCYGARPSECLSCLAGTHWNGFECSTCHWGCRKCTGPSQHECSVCNVGYYNYGNGSCIKTCEWPFRIEGTKNDKRCVKPCEAGQYILKPENKCVDECPKPYSKFLRDTVLTCESPCSGRQFLYWNGSCVSSCPLPLGIAANSFAYLCTNPCEGGSLYLYSNRACLPSCPAPLQIRTDPGVNYCLNPCQQTNHYLYNNGSCHLNCRSPMRVKVENGIKYCMMPCDSATEFILGDGSCSAECPAPLVRRIEPSVGIHCLSPCESRDHFISGDGSSCLAKCPSSFKTRIDYGVKYCLSPCLAADEYYFEHNKSCLSTCPLPLKFKLEAGVRFCYNPCPEFSLFLYDDQSCHKDCPMPLVSSIEPGKIGKYCRSPCNGENKYLNFDGSCQEICEYPYKAVNKGSYQMCLIDMTPSQMNQARSIGEIVKRANTMNKVGGLLSSLVNTGDPTSLLMIPLLKMLEMVRYTEIVLPASLGLSLNQGHSSGREIGDLQMTFSSGIEEIGIILSITLLLSGALKAITPVFSRSKSALWLQRCSFALQWNILIPLFISKLGDFVLYSIMAFNHFGIQRESYRIFILFGILPLTILLMLKIIAVGLEVKKIKESCPKEHLERGLFHLQRWRFLFDIYKSDRLYHQLFVFIYIVRITVVSGIIGCLYEYPLIQAVFLALISFGMLCYLIFNPPIEKKISFFQHVVIEITLLLYNILLVLLALKKETQNTAGDVRNALGQLMTILGLITSLIMTGIIMVKLLDYAYYLYCKTLSPNIGSPSGGFIQLSEVSHSEEGNEQNTDPSHIMIIEEEKHDSEEDLIEPATVPV